MLVLTFFLLITTFISIFVSQKINYGNIIKGIKNKHFERTVSFINVFFVTSILIFFAGFRTSYNDTLLYSYLFNNNVPTGFNSLLQIQLSLGAYPGFEAYQIIIKTIFGANPQYLIFLSSLIFVSVFTTFFYKYSSNFTLSIFFFITTGLYIFGMAAIKQTLAMAIAIIAIKFLIQKKYFIFVLIIVIASTFHPYILLYLLLPFLMKEIWSKQLIFVSFITLVSIMFFEIFVNYLVVVTNDITGKSYQESSFLDSEGMNFLRIIIWAVVPILSAIFKKKIEERSNSFINLCINASIIGFLLIIPGFFGGANMFGRLAYFFLPFSIISLIWIIMNVFRYKYIVLLASMLGYFLFYLYQYRNFINEFNHMFLNI